MNLGTPAFTSGADEIPPSSTEVRLNVGQQDQFGVDFAFVTVSHDEHSLEYPAFNYVGQWATWEVDTGGGAAHSESGFEVGYGYDKVAHGYFLCAL